MVSGLADGQPMPDQMLKQAKRVCQGDETTTTVAGKLFIKAKFTINPSQKPRTIDYEMTDIHVTVSGNLAFSRSLNRIAGTKINGPGTSIWVRATICFLREAGEWKVIHQHISVPFYMDGSLKAAVDLEPDALKGPVQPTAKAEVFEGDGC